MLREYVYRTAGEAIYRKGQFQNMNDVKIVAYNVIVGRSCHIICADEDILSPGKSIYCRIATPDSPTAVRHMQRLFIDSKVYWTGLRTLGPLTSVESQAGVIVSLAYDKILCM